MFEKYTDAELYTFERRCLDLMTHQDPLERANTHVLMACLRNEIERRALKGIHRRWLQRHQMRPTARTRGNREAHWGKST